MKTLKIIFFLLFFVFDVWVIASCCEVAAKNLHENPVYSEANFFMVITKGDRE